MKLMADGISVQNSSKAAWMDKSLLEAVTSGNFKQMKELVGNDQAILLRTTPIGNTCLHISTLHGHDMFCEKILSTYPSHVTSLLTAINDDWETPLLVAMKSGHVSLASIFLKWYHYYRLREAILVQDKHKCNALHHAIRSSHKNFALELIDIENDLSFAVNEYNESPMFIAVMRDYVFDRLLKISGSAHAGATGYNAPHAAVRNGNSVLAKRIDLYYGGI